VEKPKVASRAADTFIPSMHRIVTGGSELTVLMSPERASMCSGELEPAGDSAYVSPASRSAPSDPGTHPAPSIARRREASKSARGACGGFLTAGLLMLMALLLVACGSRGEEDRRRRPTPSVSASPTPSPEAAEVIAAWHRYWQVYVAVGSEMALPDPRLAEVATGDALRALNTGFLAYRSQGEVIRGTVDLAPKVTAIDAARATLSDCYASHILGYNRATGEPVGREPSERTLVTVSMVLEGGNWKVAGIRHEGDGCTPAS
jgi:hypothetical protein